MGKAIKITVTTESLDKAAELLFGEKPPVYFEGEIALKAWSRRELFFDCKIESSQGPVCPVVMLGTGESYKRPVGSGERIEFSVADDAGVDWDDPEAVPERSDVLSGELLNESWLTNGTTSLGALKHRYDATVRVKISDVVADDRRALDWLLSMFVDGATPHVTARLYRPTASSAASSAEAQITFDEHLMQQTLSALVAADDFRDQIKALSLTDLVALSRAAGIKADEADAERDDLVLTLSDAVEARRATPES